MSPTATRTGSAWLEKLLCPTSVALVGASDDPQHTGGRIIGYLERYGYGGRVFLVNPRRDRVQGQRAYPNLSAIDEPIDIAFITIPAPQVSEVLMECGERGVTLAYVGSSGFAEVGGEGAALQQQLADVAKEAGVRVVGPNGNGIISVRSQFAASFMTGLDQDRYELTDRHVALVSQSGAVGSFIFSMAQASGLGIGTFVSTGNEIDITFEELLFELLHDDQTKIILGYVEGLRDPSTFVKAARLAQDLGKAIVLLKVGTTPEGAIAAASHTAALVGEDRVYDGIMSQLGVLRAGSLSHLLDIARLLIRYGTDIGSRMTVLTISGGVGIMLSDLASRHGMTLAPWSPDLQVRAGSHLPSWCSTHNPIDTTGVMAKDENALRRLVEISDENPASDFTVVALGNFEATESATSDVLIELSASVSKPLIPVWIAGSGAAIDKMNREGLPCFAEPRSLIEAVATIATRHDPTRHRVATREALPSDLKHLISRARFTDTPILDEITTQALLTHFGITTVPYYEVRSPGDEDIAIAALGFPLVAKLRSRRLAHKTDHGAVLQNLNEKDQVLAGTRHLLEIGRRLALDDATVVLQPQILGGAELLLGMAIDPTFGAVLMMGIGGTQTEAIDDIQIRLPELDDTDVEHALSSLRHQRFLHGFRGTSVVTPDVLSPIVRQFARLVRETEGDFDSIDLNPVIVHDPGPVASVADALFVLSKNHNRPTVQER